MATWSLNFHAAHLFDVRRWRRRAARNCVQPMLAVAEATPARDAGREVDQRRAEAMRGFFPKLSAWMAQRNYLSEMAEVDRYLSQATDLYDLERRIRDFERRGSTTRLFQ
jgi:hypothetical protein